MASADGSELLSYGPWGPVGKQVQIDSLWDQCLLKEQRKARRNYFLSWSGEKSIVTRLESGRAQSHMWAHATSTDFRFAKTCERLGFSGVHTSTQRATSPQKHGSFHELLLPEPCRKMGFYLRFWRHKPSPNFITTITTHVAFSIPAQAGVTTQAASLW